MLGLTIDILCYDWSKLPINERAITNILRHLTYHLFSFVQFTRVILLTPRYM